MFSLVLLCLLSPALSVLQARILTSPRTPFDSESVFSQAILTVPSEIATVLTVASSPSDISEWRETAVLDCLYDRRLSEAARAVIDRRLYLRLWSERGRFPQQLLAYARALNLTKITVLCSPGSLATAQELVDADPCVFREILTVPENLGLEFARQFVVEAIKPRGLTQVVLLTDAKAAFQLLSALDFAGLLRPGYFYLLSEEAAYFRSLSAASFPEVYAVADQFAAAGNRNAAEAQAIGKVLQDFLQTGLLQPPIRHYSLFSIANSTAVRVAASPAELQHSAHFSVPLSTQSLQATIRASVNYEVVNPNLAVFPLGRQLMRGFEVAFDEVNNRSDVIPDYYMEDFSVGFTGMDFTHNMSKSRISDGRKDLGLVYMTTPISKAIVGITEIFSELNLTIPIIAGSLNSKLSDPKAFPLYLRPRVSNRYVISTLARFVRLWNWRQVAVLSTADSGDGEDAYSQFVAFAAQLDINITNSGRRLPPVLDSSTAAVVNSSLAEIQQSTTRVILIIHLYNFVVMEQMYDLGMKDEYVILLISGLNDAAYNDQKYYKRRVISKGAISLMPRVFAGQVGAKVQQELAKRDGNGMYANTCFFYDAAFLYFYAIDYLLQRGMDYENPFTLVKAMRETHFQGCGGFFKIEAGSNDRAAAEMVITNFQYNSDDDTYVLKEVGSYNPFSTQLYQFTGKVQWPDGKDLYADVKPMYENCPFLRESVRPSSLSFLLSSILISLLFLYTLLFGYYLFRRWQCLSFAPLHTRHIISQEDRLMVSTVFFEYFQLAAVGPSLDALSPFLASLCSAAVIDFEKEHWSSGGPFWVKLNVALSLVGLIALSFLSKTAGVHRKLATVCCAADYLIDALLPTFLFQPIVSTLESVLMCREGVSAVLTGSFLDRDCFEFCWTGRHLGYAVGAVVAFVLYFPIAVLTKLLWQELQTGTHIKTLPFAIVSKSLLQVFLVSISHLLKPSHALIHTVLFFAANVLTLALMLKFRFYNYNRLNLWQVIVTIALLSLCCCGYISTATGGNYNGRIWIVLVLEHCVLVGAGVLVQRFDARFEAMLERERDKDVRGLFIFAFTTGQRAQDGLEMYYRANKLSAHSRYSIGPDDQLI